MLNDKFWKLLFLCLMTTIFWEISFSLTWEWIFFQTHPYCQYYKKKKKALGSPEPASFTWNTEYFIHRLTLGCLTSSSKYFFHIQNENKFEKMGWYRFLRLIQHVENYSLFNVQWAILIAKLWLQQITFDEMTMISALQKNILKRQANKPLQQWGGFIFFLLLGESWVPIYLTNFFHIKWYLKHLDMGRNWTHN